MFEKNGFQCDLASWFYRKMRIVCQCRTRTLGTDDPEIVQHPLICARLNVFAIKFETLHP